MSLLDFVFPRKCLGCGRTGGYFCADCLNFLSLTDEPICPTCGRLSAGGLTHPGCRRPLEMDGLTATFAYKGLIKKVIKKIKYRFISDMAGDLVEAFLSFAGENKTFSDFVLERPILVPIPLHIKRFRWRGFNQSELLGELIAENLGLDFVPNLLKRIKETVPQADLSKEDRQKNIQNAFVINPGYKSQVISSKFIIFDDVWTSGSTLHEATKILKRGGAEKVWGVTLAR
jgi:ComF family protein